MNFLRRLKALADRKSPELRDPDENGELPLNTIPFDKKELIRRCTLKDVLFITEDGTFFSYKEVRKKDGYDTSDSDCDPDCELIANWRGKEIKKEIPFIIRSFTVRGNYVYFAAEEEVFKMSVSPQGKIEYHYVRSLVEDEFSTSCDVWYREESGMRIFHRLYDNPETHGIPIDIMRDDKWGYSEKYIHRGRAYIIVSGTIGEEAAVKEVDDTLTVLEFRNSPPVSVYSRDSWKFLVFITESCLPEHRIRVLIYDTDVMEFLPPLCISGIERIVHIVSVKHGLLTLAGFENDDASVDSEEDLFLFTLKLPEMELFESRFLSEFKPVKILGQGTHGSCVFEARNFRDGKNYAVKRIAITGLQEVLHDASANKIIIEVDAIARLKHTGIASYYSSWKEELPVGRQTRIDEALLKKVQHLGTFNSSVLEASASSSLFVYIQMELGVRTLRDWLEENKKRDLRDDTCKYDFSREKSWFIQLLSAVEYLHRIGKIHRNLKPSNILLTKDDTLLISDPDYLAADYYERNETRSRYAAPEQKGNPGDTSKVDVFSLGFILGQLCVYEPFLNGTDITRQPWREKWLQKVADQSEELVDLVAMMTNKKAEKRPDCTEILQQLQHKSKFMSKFEHIKVLGHGSYGCAFQVRDLNDHCEYAVKRIPLSDRQVKKAREEAEGHAPLNHQGIVSYKGSWVEEPPKGWQKRADKLILKKTNFTEKLTYEDTSKFLYIKMEFCVDNLRSLLDHKGTSRDSAQAKKWFEELVAAVAYLHDHKKIHRDLKPANILIGKDRRLKICDFGVVAAQAILDGKEIDETRTAARGTRKYMAPEQDFPFCKPTSKSDVFSLGLILTELCVRLARYEALEVFLSYRQGRGWPSDLPRSLPDGMNELVARMTHMDPEKRPSCNDILMCAFLRSSSAVSSDFGTASSSQRSDLNPGHQEEAPSPQIAVNAPRRDLRADLRQLARMHDESTGDMSTLNLLDK